MTRSVGRVRLFPIIATHFAFGEKNLASSDSVFMTAGFFSKPQNFLFALFSFVVWSLIRGCEATKKKRNIEAEKKQKTPSKSDLDASELLLNALTANPKYIKLPLGVGRNISLSVSYMHTHA